MRMKKLLSLFLALVMVLSLVPATVFAAEGEYVYISVSDDANFITDSNGDAMAYRAVALDDLAAIDLNQYGLADFIYDADSDGKQDITALHLYIYTHDFLLGGSWNSDVTVTGGAGSAYLQNGLFGFSDENLRYNYNGAYPADESGWGFTCDRIVLSDGDYLDVAHFSDWSFYMDSAYGFHYFVDSNDSITHAYTAEAGSELSVKLVRVGGGMGIGDVTTHVSDYTIYYGQTIGNDANSVTTDDNGCATITFPSSGTWHVWCDGGYGAEYPDAIVSAPGYATVTVTAAEEPAPEEPDTPRDPQSVSTVLNATMAQLAATVTEPVFGTTAGEWTVLSLARGNYYAKNNAYFTGYYDRIVETVNTTAASVNMSGALHKNKSTENSRLIVALSALGKDATSVGDWDLVEAYSANGFDWIKKQGLNGTIWALIALDSNNYATTDATIRQQCVDSILSLQHDDGGWALQANLAYASDPDVTGMALTALYPYRDQPEVAAACEEAFACLSTIQNDNGTYTSGGSECAESCAWVIVAATTWGINPDTDSRFIKNGNSVVDGLLAHYLEDEAQFQHIIGAGSNAMATDQSCYALVAYDRFMNSKAALFDYSDVEFEKAVVEGEPKASLTLPEDVANDVGTTFTATISIDQWNNDAEYKLIDFMMSFPFGITVEKVTVGERLNGGEISYGTEELKDESGEVSGYLLRATYFDANAHSDLTVSAKASTDGNNTAVELFTVTFKMAEALDAGEKLNISLEGMSLKKTSDSSDENAMTVVDLKNNEGTVEVVNGLSYEAMELYVGDDVDLIPSDIKAVAVMVTGIKDGKAPELIFDEEICDIELLYSEELTAKLQKATYVALVESTIAMTVFTEKENYTLNEKEDAKTITFGDANNDGVINAQDALAAVDAWLRKSAALEDKQILALNVNGDSRINTFDALGIVECFVEGSTYGVVTKVTTAAANT